MGFIMEFAENLILRLMEDPKERDRRFREHVYAVKDRCQKTKEMWSYPIRPYGFWTFDRHNAQLACLLGMLKLAKSLAAGTHMMTSFKITMASQSECKKTMQPLADRL